MSSPTIESLTKAYLDWLAQDKAYLDSLAQEEQDSEEIAIDPTLLPLASYEVGAGYALSLFPTMVPKRRVRFAIIAAEDKKVMSHSGYWAEVEQILIKVAV